jgi:hypothetical protein
MIRINLDKAKNITHEKRRIARSKEFAPWDEIISKQIPGTSMQEAESQRQSIRNKYEQMQNEIDAATNVATLKSIITTNNL